MSGIDEQSVDVPQCPMCKRTHEFFVGNGVWMFPRQAVIKRGLKYSLFFLGRNPTFNRVRCLRCDEKFSENSMFYKTMKKCFDAIIKSREFYSNREDFNADDQHWESNGES